MSRDLEAAIARWQLGLLSGDDLPGIAISALESGLNSPSLCVLATLVHPTLREAGPVFREALEELGRFSGTLSDDPLMVVTQIASRMLSGEIGMIPGCRLMTRLRGRSKLIDGNLINPFVAIDSLTDEIPVGATRELWSEAAWPTIDRKIADAEAAYQAEIEQACRALIKVYSRQ